MGPTNPVPEGEELAVVVEELGVVNRVVGLMVIFCDEYGSEKWD